MNEAKFDALNDYGNSPLFSEAEKAALDYATLLTRDKKMDAGTFARLAAHYSGREVCEIVWLVASEHLYNITNIGMNIHSDMLCDIRKEKALKAQQAGSPMREPASVRDQAGQAN